MAPLITPIDDRKEQVGGAQVLLADLTAGLAARGHRVTLGFLVVSRRAHRSSTWAGRDLESAANTVMNAGSVFGMGTR